MATLPQLKEDPTVKAEHLTIDPQVVIKIDKPTFTEKWALVSFVSPEDRIKQRFFFEANRFLYHDVNKQIVDTTTNITRNLNMDFSKLLEKKINSYQSSTNPIYKAAAEILDSTRKELQIGEDEQISKVLRTYRLDEEELNDRFEAYKIQNSKELESDFNQKYTPETSIRGFKVRGVYEELDEVRAKAAHVRKNVESHVHTFVAPVGYWCPYDPNADAIQDQEHMVVELNDLMGKKKQNAEQSNEFFEKRKQQMIEDSKNPQKEQLKQSLRQKVKQQAEQRKRKQ
jgi:hypothetical protein